jgi:hypothetical protein
MDSLENKVNNDTIKFVNKIYKGLSIINSERFYLPTKNQYDDKIENCIYQIHDILHDMYHASIDKKTSYDMELYDSDSDIPDVQGTFDECITPRTPRVVNKPSTPSAPVKPGKKIIVEEESEEDFEEVSEEESDEDVEEYEDVVEEEGDVLSHIMGYSDSEESDDSDGSYEKISDEEDDDKRISCEKLSNTQQKQYHVFMKNKVKEYKKTYPRSNIIYDDIYNIRDEQADIINTFNMGDMQSYIDGVEVVEQLSLEYYKKKYPDASIEYIHNSGNYKLTHNGSIKELVFTGLADDRETEIYASYPYPY